MLPGKKKSDKIRRTNLAKPLRISPNNPGKILRIYFFSHFINIPHNPDGDRANRGSLALPQAYRSCRGVFSLMLRALPLWEITFIVTERKYGGAGGEESESDERFMGLAKEGVIATTNRSQEWDG